MNLHDKVELVEGICEMCGTRVNKNDLYVDLFNNTFALECPSCFKSRNETDVEGYADRVRTCLPNLYSEREWGKHKKALIAIGDAYIYMKDKEAGSNIAYFEKTEIDSCKVDAIKKMLDSRKIRSKFTCVNTEVKITEEPSDDTAVLKVLVRSYVRFNSYLEFVEHELYMHFKSQVKSIFTLTQ